jgi:hypothetical protein
MFQTELHPFKLLFCEVFTAYLVYGSVAMDRTPQTTNHQQVSAGQPQLICHGYEVSQSKVSFLLLLQSALPQRMLLQHLGYTSISIDH